MKGYKKKQQKNPRCFRKRLSFMAQQEHEKKSSWTCVSCLFGQSFLLLHFHQNQTVKEKSRVGQEWEREGGNALIALFYFPFFPSFSFVEFLTHLIATNIFYYFSYFVLDFCTWTFGKGSALEAFCLALETGHIYRSLRTGSILGNETPSLDYHYFCVILIILG